MVQHLGFCGGGGGGRGSGEVIGREGLLVWHSSLLRWEMVGWSGTLACWGEGMVCCSGG